MKETMATPIEIPPLTTDALSPSGQKPSKRLRGTRKAIGEFTFLTMLLACLTHLHAASTVQFNATSFTVAESDGAATLAVQRSGDASTSVSVDYTTTNLSALAGIKYTATSGTLAFAAGETTKVILVPVQNNGFVDGAKTFRVALSRPTGDAILGLRTNAVVTITDNDLGLDLDASTYSIAEDAGQILIGVVRRDDGTLPVTVEIATTDLSAVSGVDYAGTSQKLSFAPQEHLKRVPIAILNNIRKQPNRSFRVTLSNPSGATLGSTKLAAVTILDNDQGFQFESSTNSVVEDCGLARIRVLRGTDDTSSTLTVDLSTTDVSAIMGSDYVGFTNILTFAPGERVKEVGVQIINNGIKQATRKFRLNLSRPGGDSVLGHPTSTTVSILDNDPGVGFERTGYTNAWGKEGATVTVSRGNDRVLVPITVDYATSDLTALAGQDYQAVSGTLTFEENEMVKSLTIPILRPRPPGGTKGFQVTLGHATDGAALGTQVTTVQIAGSSVTLAPPFETLLTIGIDSNRSTLTWTGGGQLQRADRSTGPWQTLAAAKSPTTIESTIPASFYRVTSPRPANIYVPSSYDGHTPLPLVLLLHGHGDTAADTENYMQFGPLAEMRGFLYCYPDSTVDPAGDPFWNATDACCDFFNSGTDDAGVLRSLIEEIGRQFAVDNKRVYLIGHSNGGFMSYRMACQSADLIAGIASLAGTTFLDPDHCPPSQAVNILHIHGTADTAVPYGGGASQGAASNLSQAPGVLQTVRTWAGYNGATGQTTEATPSIKLTAELPGLDTIITRYTNAPAGGAVELWTIVGGSHRPALSPQFQPRVIDWLFAHPRP